MSNAQVRKQLTREAAIAAFNKIKHKLIMEGDCLVKRTCVGRKGYSITYVGGPNPKTIMSHRVSYLANVGLIPDGMMVCHKCDNPGCVKPEHLFLGTGSDNVMDSVRKGRWNQHLKVKHAVGERASKSKLKDGEVVEIYKSSEPAAVLARKYGVGPAAIYNIRLGVSWTHVTGALEKPASYRKLNNGGVSYETALKIKNATGLHREIAKRFGTNRTSVGNIKSGKTPPETFRLAKLSFGIKENVRSYPE